MKSLGYVECNGLSGAIVAADRMLKTADVELSSIQNTKGNGWVTLKVAGELSAVTVAVQAVKDYLPKVYVTSTVIGRPASGLDSLGKTDLLNPVPEDDGGQTVTEKTVVIKPTPVKDQSTNEADQGTVGEQPTEVTQTTISKEEQNSDSDKEVTCNMCGDPNCPRKLGEPHKKCIHYNELKKK